MVEQVRPPPWENRREAPAVESAQHQDERGETCLEARGSVFLMGGVGLDRFTLDRRVRIVTRLDQRIEGAVTRRPRGPPAATPRPPWRGALPL